MLYVSNQFIEFCDDAPGVDGELTGDSISFWESFLLNLTSSLFIFWLMLIQIFE